MAVHEQPLVVYVDVLDGSATVAVQGEIDIATVADLRDGLAKALAAMPCPLMVDLGATTFIDGSGMSAIAEARRDAPPGCQVVLRSPNRLARKVIELTGIDQSCLIDD